MGMLVVVQLNHLAHEVRQLLNPKLPSNHLLQAQ
jgi:hypothetical protein